MRAYVEADANPDTHGAGSHVQLCCDARRKGSAGPIFVRVYVRYGKYRKPMAFVFFFWLVLVGEFVTRRQPPVPKDSSFGNGIRKRAWIGLKVRIHPEAHFFSAA